MIRVAENEAIAGPEAEDEHWDTLLVQSQQQLSRIGHGGALPSLRRTRKHPWSS